MPKGEYIRKPWAKFGKKEWLICSLVNKGSSYTQITEMTGMDRSQAARIYVRWNEEYLKNPDGKGIIGGMERYNPNKNKK